MRKLLIVYNGCLNYTLSIILSVRGYQGGFAFERWALLIGASFVSLTFA
jgi:hypothetical protein